MSAIAKAGTSTLNGLIGSSEAAACLGILPRPKAVATASAARISRRVTANGLSEICLLLRGYGLNLGSGLIDQSQKMTAAAMQMAEKKVWAHRS